MRPGATTGWRRCHKTRPTGYRDSQAYHVNNSSDHGNKTMEHDRQNGGIPVSDIVSHTGRARCVYSFHDEARAPRTRVIGCHGPNRTASRGLFRCQHHRDAEEILTACATERLLGATGRVARAYDSNRLSWRTKGALTAYEGAYYKIVEPR